MTQGQTVMKAKFELKKILNSNYEYLSNEHFRIRKLRKFIDKYINTKGNTKVEYHQESLYIEKELNDILTWDKSRLN